MSRFASVGLPSSLARGRWGQRALTLVASLTMAMIVVPSARAALVFDGSPGSGAPPATLGGFTMHPSPQDTRPEGTLVTDAPATPTSSFSFDQTMSLMTIGSAFCSSNWAGGTYGGDVYFSNGASTVTITLPAPANAIYFYADPSEYGTFNMQATAQDGSSVSSGPTPIPNNTCFSSGPSGQYFGFYGTGGEKIQSVTVSFVDSSADDTEFAVGDFALDSVPAEPPITASGTTFTSREGTPLTGQQVASFSGDPGSPASDYQASIDWGDGSGPSSGTIVPNPSGGYNVLGSHTYNEESPPGGYTVKVTITDLDSPSNTATATSTANVSDAPLYSICPTQAPSTRAFSGPTAMLTDSDPNGTASDYTASIDWGDGSSSPGTISGGGPFTVAGSHTYSSTGSFTVRTTITDAGGSSTVASCKVLVYGFAPGGGAFVISDRRSAPGTSVTFWGAQWWKQNPLSAGAAPASFKGFAGEPSLPTCGASWSSRPGASSQPPDGPLPRDMAVIVSSHVSQSGSLISGDVEHVVVVKTNPGYEPDPGHPGTGTVDARIC